jgi:hypothetical protein
MIFLRNKTKKEVVVGRCVFNPLEIKCLTEENASKILAHKNKSIVKVNVDNSFKDKVNVKNKQVTSKEANLK